jgi:hypothetical protein
MSWSESFKVVGIIFSIMFLTLLAASFGLVGFIVLGICLFFGFVVFVKLLGV